jgi:hypothetical protein
MSELFDAARAYFQEQAWPVELKDDDEILRFRYEGDHGKWMCFARARSEAGQFIFLSVLSEKVPKDKRPLIAEFLTRANFGLNVGNFEMDFEDGEIRFRTSLDVAEARLTSGLINPLVKASLVAMDDHLPGIQAVMAGTATPKKAIAAIRAADDDVDLVL